MVNNINGYNVGNITPTNYPRTNNPNQGTVSPAQNSGYTSNDGYSFNMNTIPTGRVPDAKVGIWDKAGGLFSNVLNTPQNMQLYKNFQSAMKSTPSAFLESGSTDVTKVKDLQRKLNYLGYGLTVNGNFGAATEKAVVNFKISNGINDGFLDKQGKFAVSSIVTPDMYRLMNAQVAQKLNPNGNSGSYTPPVTQEEINWAKQLQNKIVQYGYKPSPAERQKYDNIYQRQQLGMSIQNGSYNPNVVPAPTSQEIGWAKELLTKMKNYGYKPNPQEIQKYQDIQKRQQLAKNNPAPIEQSQMQTQQVNAVSQQEMDWAVGLMNKIKSGYTPSPAEEQKYQEIFNRSKSIPTTNVGGVQTPQATLSQDELVWAKSLEQKVDGGYNPNQQEISKYNDIFARYKQVKTQETQAPQQAQQNTQAVTQEELQWAQQIEAKVNGGGSITPQEKANYEQIYARYQQYGSANATTQIAPAEKPTDSEVSWALDLEKRTQTGYQPTQQEIAIYTEIAKKIEAYTNAQQSNSSRASGGATKQELAFASSLYTKMQSGYQPSQQEMAMLNRIQSKIAGGDQTQAPVQQQTTENVSKPQSKPRSQAPQNVNFAYSDQTIEAFRNAFPNVTFSGGAVPYLPANAAQKVSQQLGFNSVEELQSAIGAKVDGKFGPETFFRLQNAGQKNSPEQEEETTPMDATVQTQNTQPQSQGVTSEELNWANSLQSKFKQGYKPNDQEVARYTDIFNRYQASGGQVNQATTTQSSAPTDQELQWAAQLQEKHSQGYKPTQEEIAKYNDIYTRYQSGGVTTKPQVQQTQPASNLPTYQTSLDPNTPKVGVNVSSASPELQWALQLLDRVQNQGYVPNEQEIKQYEAIIAANQSAISMP